MKFLQTASVRLSVLFAAIFLFSLPVFSQDAEPIVVDEVIAQVNEGVITLSRIKRETKSRVEAIAARQPDKSRDELQREFDAKRPELIAEIINEELIIQQGKELGLEQDVEQEINSRFVELMKRYQIKTLEELYKQMRAEGVEPDDLKSVWRREIMPALVFRQDVDGKIYYGLTEKELRSYFDKNKEKFRKPETVSLSEIFLSFAGRNEADVKTKAADLVRQLRAGANFETFVAQHSERPDSQKAKGKVGTFEVPTLNAEIATPLKNVKAGGYTDPIRSDEGMMILRVDERVNDSATPVFDDRRVREAITNERTPEARKKYLTKLRTEAYIKISPNYETAVKPFLFKDNTKG